MTDARPPPSDKFVSRPRDPLHTASRRGRLICNFGLSPQPRPPAIASLSARRPRSPVRHVPCYPWGRVPLVAPVAQPSRDRGFTIIELVSVLGLIGLMCGIMFGSFQALS